MNAGITESDRHLLGRALLAGDPSPEGLAHYGGIDLDRAVAIVDAAVAVGWISDTGAVDEFVRTTLIGELSPSVRGDIHTQRARALLAEGPNRLDEAIEQLRAAASLGDAEPALELADHAGRLCLSLGDYTSAAALLALALEYDVSPDLVRQGHRLCDLAVASDGQGDLKRARDSAARAVALGELAREAHLVARAAVLHALPVDWNAGDKRTYGLLERAERMPLELEDRVMVIAARALAEMRIPVIAGEHQQVAWVTRPGVSQPLAEQALVMASSCSAQAQCLASLAWRSTHRSPVYLDRRRTLSTHALELAQTARHRAFQVEAALWQAVDAIESADRNLADEALAVAMWAARSDGNPRLVFRALTLATGMAILDGNHERARVLMEQTSETLSRFDSSLLVVAHTLFTVQMAIKDDRPDVLATLRPDLSAPLLTHPLGRAAASYLWARSGQHNLAVEQTRQALLHRDHETSLLLVATRAAAVAYETGNAELCREVIDILEPYREHVSVDANGWWCDGPVSLWLAVLHHRLGSDVSAESHLTDAVRIARGLQDVRSLRHLDTLRHQLRTVKPTHAAGAAHLTERERTVLRHLATGATNAHIAHLLAYSVSTIRNDTISIYRKLGVSGRPDAVAAAISHGLLP